MKIALACFIILLSHSAGAVELRAFFAGRQLSANEMNSALDSQQLKQIKQVPGFGVEADAEAIPRIHFGLRFETYHLHVGDGSSTTFTADPGFSEVNATMYQAVMRWTLADSSALRFDIFGGAGGITGNMKSKAANGTEYQQGLDSMDMRFMQSAGVTLAIGKPSFYVTLEGGYQWANLNSLKHDPGSNPVVNSIDLRGPFATLGFVFNPGMTGKSK